MGKLALIADFLENGLEHCDREEALDHLEYEFGIDEATAWNLIEQYRFQSRHSMLPSDTELYELINDWVNS